MNNSTKWLKYLNRRIKKKICCFKKLLKARKTNLLQANSIKRKLIQLKMLPPKVRSRFMANSILKTQKKTMEIANQMKRNVMDLISKKKISILLQTRWNHVFLKRYKTERKIMFLFSNIFKKDTRSGQI